MKIVSVVPSDPPYPPDCTMDDTFTRYGHQFVGNVDDADIAFFSLSPSGFHSESMQKVLDRRLPVVVFDCFEYTSPPPENPDKAGAFDMEPSISWGIHWAIWLQRFMANGLVKLHFVRRMTGKWVNYPSHCRPFDHIMHHGHDFPPVSKEELNSRPYDVAFVGTVQTYPLPRENIVRSLRNTGLKVDLEIVPDAGRMEHGAWLDRMRQAKMFCAADGPGDCSNRRFELINISVMLTLRNHQILPAPWTHGFDCVMAADPFGNMEEGDEEIIRSFLDDPDKLYSIYLNGIEHMRKYNTPQARAEYVLKTMREVGLL